MASLAIGPSVAAAALPTWLDLSDRPIDPFATNAATAIVFIFIKTDCPISNRYAPEVERLHKKFQALGVRFWLVHTDPDVSVETIRQHTKDYRYSCGVLRDPRQELAHLCQARVTPEAAVFTAERRLVYHGRIDDRFVQLGQERPAPTRRDLEAALTAMLQGKPVVQPSTPAIGCTIAPVTPARSHNAGDSK